MQAITVQVRFHTLRFISGLLAVMAVLLLVGSVLAVWRIDGGGELAVIGLVVGAVVGSVVLLAFSEFLKVYIEVEHNTRHTVALLGEVVQRLPPNDEATA